MRLILIHGFNATPADHFYLWLAEEMRKQGWTVVTPRLPLSTTTELDMPGIITTLQADIGQIKSTDIFLGHSLGAFVGLQFLEAVQMTETPHAFFFVASPWKVSKPELRRLFLADIDADVLMWKARQFLVIHSNDDTLLSVEHAKALAEAFKAKLLLTDGCGHFMDREYPLLRDTLLEVAATPWEFAPGMSLENDFEDQTIGERVAASAPPEAPSDWMQ